MTGRSGTTVGVALVALFVGAAILNAQAWLMGYPVSAVNLAGTLTALIAWPVYGAWMGSTQRARAHPWRFPVAFRSVVVVLAVGGRLLMTAGSASSSIAAIGIAGGAAFFLGTAPFYGLTGLTYFGEWHTSVVVGVSVIVLVATLLANSYALRRYRR